MFSFSVQLLSETVLILQNNVERDVMTNVRWCSCKVPAGLVTFWSNWNFIKIPKCQISKTPTSGSRVIACEQTNTTKRAVSTSVYVALCSALNTDNWYVATQPPRILMYFFPLRSRPLTFAKVHYGVAPSSSSASQINTALCVAASASAASYRKMTLLTQATFNCCTRLSRSFTSGSGGVVFEWSSAIGIWRNQVPSGIRSVSLCCGTSVSPPLSTKNNNNNNNNNDVT